MPVRGGHLQRHFAARFDHADLRTGETCGKSVDD
jgi:hypothetical protein